MIDSQYFENKKFIHPIICNKYKSCFECKEKDCTYDINYKTTSLKKELENAKSSRNTK